MISNRVSEDMRVMYFVNGHFKVHHCWAFQNVPPWSVGSSYRQVVHF